MTTATAGSASDTREQHRVTGAELLDKVKELAHQGNIRRIVIKNDEGRTLVELPLSIGVVGAVLAPVLAAVGAIAALVGDCTIEVERSEEPAS
jgi:hypothetical protein